MYRDALNVLPNIVFADCIHLKIHPLKRVYSEFDNIHIHCSYPEQQNENGEFYYYYRHSFNNEYTIVKSGLFC